MIGPNLWGRARKIHSFGSAGLVPLASALALAVLFGTAAADPAEPPRLRFGHSLSARIAYESTPEHDWLEFLLVPYYRVERSGEVVSFDASLGADAVREARGETRLGALRLDGFAEAALGPATSALASADVEAIQGPSFEDVSAPISVEGAGQVSVRHSLGRVATSAALRVERDDLYFDIPVVAEDFGYWVFGGSLRLGVEHGADRSTFAELRYDRQVHDDRDLGGLNTDTYALLLGVEAEWSERLTAQIATGVALEAFDDPRFARRTKAIAEAEIAYETGSALELSADLSAEHATESTAFEIDAEFEFEYRLTPSLRLIAEATWEHERNASGDHEHEVSIDLGTALLLGTGRQFDLRYEFDRAGESGERTENGHRVSFGITLTQ